MGVGGLDRDQILRLLAEREAACQAEVVRLEQEAARIAGLIEERGKVSATSAGTASGGVSAPDSTSNTRVAGSSDSRAANVAPALPPPTIRKSGSCIAWGPASARRYLRKSHDSSKALHASGADLTFASHPAAGSQSECQI